MEGMGLLFNHFSLARMGGRDQTRRRKMKIIISTETDIVTVIPTNFTEIKIPYGWIDQTATTIYIHHIKDALRKLATDLE